MKRTAPVPANLNESDLAEAVKAVREQQSWCPKIADIPHYELQTLLSIGIRAFWKSSLAVQPTRHSIPQERKTKGQAQTKSKRQRTLERDKYICYLCGQIIPEDQASIDHVVPRSKGGGHGLGNLRATHRNCNFRKGNMSLDEYRALYPLADPS